MNDLVDRLAVEAAATQAGRSGDGRARRTSGPADALRPGGRRAGREARRCRTATASSWPGCARPSLGRLRRRTRVADAVASPAGRDPRGQGRAAPRPGGRHRPRPRRRAAGRRGRRSRPACPTSPCWPTPTPDSVWPEAAARQLPRAPGRGAVAVVTLESQAPTSKQQAGGAIARRDAWLARHADEAVVVWDGDDERVGQSWCARSWSTWARTTSGWSSRRGTSVSRAAESAPTPAGRSPTSWPTTGRSPRCRRRRTTRARRCARALAALGGRPDAARPRHDGGHQRPARAAGRAGRAGDHRAASPTSSRSPARTGRRSTTARRPARAARAAGAAARGRRPAGRRRRRARAGRRRRGARRRRRRRGGRRVPAARRPRSRATSGPWPTRSAAAGHDVTCSSRGVARVPRVRAHGHDGGERLPAPARAGRTSRRLADVGRRGAGDDVGRRAGAGRRRRPSVPGAAAAVRSGRRRAGRGRGRPRPTASPTPSRFDMGGTSTDVCLVLGGAPGAGGRARGRPGFPVRLPSLDVHTIGAGGGSIARIDAGGALRRRPASRPAPCPGRPATAAAAPSRRSPTPTSSLGRIPADAAFPGLGRARRRRRARRARRAPASTAAGVVAVVDAGDGAGACGPCPSSGASTRGALALVAFGGAGPLHACALADALGMAAVIVPPRAGVLSAVGLLCAPVAARPGAVVADAGRPRRARRRAAWRSAMPSRRRDGRRRARGRRARRSTAGTPARATS